MTKVLPLILCLCMLFGMTASAEEAGEDSFPQEVWNDWSEEAGEPDPEDPARVMTEQLIDFLLHWSRDEYDEMLEMCATEWKNETEDPAEALLAILGERRPMTCTPEAMTGTEEDTVRTVLVRMDIRGIDMAWEHDYYFHITLQQEDDGIWRIDPESLLDYEIAEEEQQDGVE